MKTDEELLAAFVAGDQAAFTALYALHAHELPAYLARRYFGGDNGLAEDAFQQAIVRLAAEAAELDLSKPLRPWLYFTASNIAIEMQAANV